MRLLFKRFGGAVVFYDIIASGAEEFLAELRVHARSRLLQSDIISVDNPPQALLFVRNDRYYAVTNHLGVCFKELRRVVNHKPARFF